MEWVRQQVDENSPEGRLAVAYAEITAELTAIGGQLTDRCARCHLGSVGCCDSNRRHTLGMPEEMLRLQELEATRAGWTMPTDDRSHRCQFHGDRGCALTSFRPNICYAFFCEWIVEELVATDGPELVMPFIEASKAFYEGPGIKSIPEETLANMEAALVAGRALLAHRKAHGRRAPAMQLTPPEDGRVRLPIVP